MSKKDEALKLALEALEEIADEVFSPYDNKLGVAILAIREALAEQPEFIKHEVENADDWSEWVCPNPKSYLMKCCDCGLVHEAQFGVVRYKSETEREECEPVDDPNLEAVFRMRRSEQWSPADMAHRPGGLPMAEQPAQQQEPVAWMVDVDLANYQGQSEYRTILAWNAKPVHSGTHEINEVLKAVPLYTSPPASKPWVGLTDEEMRELEKQFNAERVRTSDEEYLIIYPSAYWAWQRAIEAKLREKNA